MQERIYFKWFLAVTVIFAGLSLPPLVTLHAPPPSVLEQIQRNGELVVLTRNGPTTFYEGPNGPAGFEYDLAKLFAEQLGVRLKIVTPESFDAILPLVTRRSVHLAAAGLTITEARKRRVRFGPPYQTITQQLVYRRGHTPPRSPEALAGGLVEVVEGSSHADRLQTLSLRTPIRWRSSRKDVAQLLARVWRKTLDYTVVDSNEFSVYRRYYPELRVAFDLGAPQQLAWAFPKSSDDSLYTAARRFFQRIRADGTLARLKERYFGHVQDFDYVGLRKFMRHMEQRLPRYRQYFQDAARKYGQDWRLLAAIGYQESHWNHRAISPTGVRGIMMLTRSTAAEMGYRNRIDPRNSIHGGARYFARLKRRLPASIREPDRTWFALAAYNLGLGHIRDVRDITRARGGDPDKWMDVKQNLPLLMEERWHRRTRHGYARGIEALRYVENIRSYYDLLQWQERPHRPPATTVLVRSPRLLPSDPSPIL
ncbi:MAG TPA: membrane-bound lytic murein transglycosylase MltF [Gammaproteobacteria bacterium]|nr:membrane-bound lytic murein transglycosylase MltF [Gammaproteobacteria bacterium]